MKLLSNILLKLKDSNAQILDTHNPEQTPHTFMNIREKYAAVLMLNAYGQGSPIYSQYPVYFERECGVTNPQAFHKSLIKNGYLTPASYKDMFSNFKIAELKHILDDFNLKKSGKKEDLIERIINEIAEEKLTNYVPKEPCYSLSVKGNDFLNCYLDYVELHKNSTWMVSIEEYEAVKNKRLSNDFYDNMLFFYKDKLKKSHSYELRMCYHCLSQIYNHKQDFESSLFYLLSVLYWDVNDKENYPSTQMYDLGIMSKKEIKKQYPVSLFSPGIISSIAKLQNYYSDEMVDKIYQINLTKKNLCDKKVFEEIIFDIFNAAFFPSEKWNTYLGKIYFKSINW